MSEDGFNRQLKMAINLLNNWRDFFKIQITFSNKRCQCQKMTLTDNWYGCLVFLNFNQSSCFLWLCFLFKKFFSHNWYGCLVFMNFNQSRCFLWLCFLFKKFFSRNWYVCVHIAVFEFQKYLAINFDFVNILKNFYVSEIFQP